MTLDTTTWDNSNSITIDFIGNIQTISMGSFDGQEAECQSTTQTYYRIVASYPHINSTASSITVLLNTDVTGSTCNWGFK